MTFGEQHRSLATPLDGGWSDSKFDDPMVLEAATFCLQALQSGVADTEQTKPEYSFTASTTSTAKIIKASHQVVAGINYRLTIMVLEAEICIGVFEATIYDRFGDFSVSKWKKEVSCTEGKILLEAAKNVVPGEN